MGAVTNIHWKCPGCGQNNYAQGYCEDWSEPEEGFNYTSVPLHHAICLKWNEPCENCGEYILQEHDPNQLVHMTIGKTNSTKTGE